MESVMRLSVRLSVCLVDSAVARPRRRLLAENLFGEERNAMRCDAMRCNSMLNNSSKMGERESRTSERREKNENENENDPNGLILV